MREFTREPQLWILLAGILAFFFRPLTTRTFFFRDNSLLNIPTHFLLAKYLRNGRIPLWNPLLHGGQPFLGSPTSTVLYPANLLDLFLPPLQAFNTIVVLHFALCAAFTYLLARSLGISRNASMIAGVVYALSGFSLSQANLYQKLLALPWIPFCLFAARQSTRSRPRTWTLLFILGMLTQILANSPETTIATGILVLMFVAVTARTGHRSMATLRIAAAMVLAAGLAAVQLLPTAEMAAMSSRGAHPAYERVTAWSLHPARLPELLIPGFFGRTDALSEDAYWGTRREDTGFPNILSIYFGYPALLLALLGISGSALTRRLRRWLALCALLGLLLACGRFLPGFHTLFRLIPAMAIFRYPVKAIVLSLLPVALLAGAGADAFAQKKRTVVILSFVAGALGAVGVMVWVAIPAMAASMERVVFARALTSGDRRDLVLCLAHLIAVSLAMMGASTLLKSRNREGATGDARRSARPWMTQTAWLAAIVACDLAVAGARVNPYAPRSLFDEPALAARVRSIASGSPFYRAPDPEPFHLSAPSDDLVWLARFNLQTLRYYTAQAWGQATIFHTDFDGLANRDVLHLAESTGRLPWRRRIPILTAAGARAILAPGRLLLPGLRPVYEMPTPSGYTWVLHENGSASRVRFVARARHIADREQALTFMGSGSFDPAREAILDGAAGGVPDTATASTTTIDRLQQDADRSLIRVTTAVAGWVVYAEPFAPGWTARIDDRPASLVRANYAFSAVPVPAGRHMIERAYHPRTFRFGLAGSGAALLLTGAFILLTGRRRTGASSDLEEAPAESFTRS